MNRWPSTLVLVLALAWPLLLGAAAGARIAGRGPLWTTAVYLAASRVCHQKPERSFATAGVQWPVCARCAGLYLAAPLGAAWAVRASRRTPREVIRRVLVLAALPTAATLVLEWAALVPMNNAIRFAAAWPLGAAVAFAIACAAHGPSRSIG